MNYSTKEIAEISNSKLFGDGNLLVKNLAFDSRNIFSAKNTAFLAITTEKNSGEKYIQSAIEKGINIIISEHKKSEIEGITWIIVENSIEFIQNLAKSHVGKYNIKNIGITGSNGKTVVKEWLYQCLWNEFPTVKSPKSFNSQIGLPISLLQMNEKQEIGIFEVGISKPKEMEKLQQVFSPQIGILTNIGSAHSANFSSEEELIDEKIILFKNSETIIFNGDNLLVYRKLKNKYSSTELISFGFKNHNNLKIISDWKNRNEDVKIQYFEDSFSFPVQQRDEATLMNALAIIAVLKKLLFDNNKIIEKLNQLKSVEMRLESVVGVRNNLLINDSYNLDVNSLRIAFQFINEYKKPQKILILTDIVEVKEDKDLLYKEISTLVNEQNFDEIYLIGAEITKYQSWFESETYTFNNTSELIENHRLNQIENSLILLKGARKFEIEKIKNHLELQKHDTILEINLNAILHNINVHKSLLKPETKMMAMVKAYSYGLGSYEIAEFLQHHHIDYLGVAYADEGVDLRKNGITLPIVVMNPEQHSYDSIIDYNLEPEIYSFRVLELFYQSIQQKGIQKKYPIHIKVETGMHRLGFQYGDIDGLIHKLNKMNLRIESVFSHLSSSDSEDESEFTLHQIDSFAKVSQKLISGLKYKPLRHILNSSGIANYSDYQYDMVRIGIGMVGISSNFSIKNQLQSAVTFKTVISQITEINKGDSVGYNRKYKAEKNTKIATIPVGYADGIPRLIGNNIGNVGVNKTLAPIVGNVCMDMMMIDIADLPVKEGDEVVIFNAKPTLEEFANCCKTIPYEVLTSISRRVKRIYIKD